MPTETDIQKARQRIQAGTDVIGTILKMKKQAQQAMKTGSVSQLQEAGFKVFSFDASTI